MTHSDDCDGAPHDPSGRDHPTEPLTDPLRALAWLAHEAGVDTDPVALLADLHHQASTFAVPNLDPMHTEDESLDLTVRDATLYDLVLRVGQPHRWVDDLAVDPRRGVQRLLFGCRLALQMLPEVRADIFRRYSLSLDEDAEPPRVEALERRVRQALVALHDYMGEHDRDQWADPQALVGALADVHDATRLLLMWHELWGQPAPCAG